MNMTRMTEDEVQLMDMLIETVDHYLHLHKNFTTKETYELISEYFLQLADNETTEEVVTISAYELLGDLMNEYDEETLYSILEMLSKKNIIQMKYIHAPDKRNVLKRLYIKIV